MLLGQISRQLPPCHICHPSKIFHHMKFGASRKVPHEQFPPVTWTTSKPNHSYLDISNTDNSYLDTSKPDNFHTDNCHPNNSKPTISHPDNSHLWSLSPKTITANGNSHLDNSYTGQFPSNSTHLGIVRGRDVLVEVFLEPKFVILKQISSDDLTIFFFHKINEVSFQEKQEKLLHLV